MAQKKITDLTLRSDFDTTCNLPVDDTSQTWRTTGQQLLDFIKSEFGTPTIQKFTSGSGTYSRPAGVKWIRVRMVGGGGGGNAGDDGASGGDGTATTFGTTLLVANGGVGGVFNAVSRGGAGGSASLGSGPIGIATRGSYGSSATFSTSGGSYPLGGAGGLTPFGGAGNSGLNEDGIDPSANTGNGGAGGSGSGTGTFGGNGGGAGGYVDAIIVSPSSTYPYAVGSGGAGGGSSTHVWDGRSGASGIIIVEEHYI